MGEKIILHSGRRGQISYGHPWIYKGQIKEAPGERDGDIFSVYSSGGRFLGKGYYNPRSEIAVRLLSYKDEAIDESFFARRIEHALEFRKKFVKETDACRVVFSEADGLPGLVVDKYAEYIVFQILTLGMEKKKEALVNIMRETLKQKFLYEKSDATSRRLEGLTEVKKWWGAEGKSMVTISEDKAKFLVDIETGHKTGFYLDQRDSRGAIKDLVKDKKVLDCFSYTGGFSIYASLYGAGEVLGLDVHASQVELAKKNAKLNSLPGDRIKFRTVNVFEALKEFDRSKERFDVVILDPPSFVKNKKAVENALTGYKEINLRAMKILNEGGILATFSCSGHIEEELFLQVILDAAFDTKNCLKILKKCSQAVDHPVDPFIPQTSYLKGFILAVG